MTDGVKNTRKTELERNIRVRFLLYSLIILVLLYIFAAGLFFYLRHSLRENFSREQRELIRILTGDIEDSLREIHDDLFYLTDSPFSQIALEDPSGTSGQIITELIRSMLSFHNCYDHIRLLDKGGMEIIRVNYDSRQMHVLVEPENLQNKSTRYYFTEAMALSPGEIYASPFDLNIEQGKIELPYKPMIRFARQIVDDEGETAGIAVLNYKGDHLITELLKYLKNDRINFYLLNQEGYYLYHEDRSKTFSFMFDGNESFLEDYPEAWENISCGDDYVTRQGYFFVNCLRPSSENSRRWYVVLHANQKQIAQMEGLSRRGIALGLIILTPLAISFGFLLSRSHEKNRWYMEKLEQRARIDGLTGLYNLREIMLRLEYTLSLVKRNNQELAIAFIDVNYLKYFNDTYGHEYGDQVIRAAASSIKSHIRVSDSAARIGGDEFLVIFPDCSLDNAEGIMEKIYHSFFNRGKESSRRDRDWTFCWGCTLYRDGETVKELISRADKIMYEKKRITHISPE